MLGVQEGKVSSQILPSPDCCGCSGLTASRDCVVCILRWNNNSDRDTCTDPLASGVSQLTACEASPLQHPEELGHCSPGHL